MREAGRRGRREALDYIQSLLGELRTMATAERYEMLAYLIEMAYLEASDLVRNERGRRGSSSPEDPPDKAR
jgi:hypothetical protein